MGMKYFSDFLGREIEIPDDPKRVISLAPDITDALFKLGVGDRVVGISLYCNRPKGKLDGLPRVGSYLRILWDKLNSLKPDLVFLTTGAQRKAAEEMLNKGFPVVILNVPNSIGGILENLRKIGIVMNRLEYADGLIFKLLKDLNDIMQGETKIKAYYEIDLGGSITIGGPSYITQCLRILGIENVYSFRKESYFTPKDEETRKLEYDIVIFEPKPERRYTHEDIERFLKERLGDKRIVIIEPDSLAHYGPSLLDEILPDLKRKFEKLFQK